MPQNHDITSLEGLMGNSSDAEGWPTLDEIKQRRVFIDNNLINKVEDIFRKNNHCLIRGAEGRGKTVLARVIAYNKERQDWKIRFIDVREISEDRVTYICRQIEHAAMGKKVLLVVENAHYSLDVITPQLVQLVKKYPHVHFIFTSRREEEKFSDPFEEWEDEGCYVDLTPDLKEVGHIIETFISSAKINYSLTEQDISWIVTEFGEKAVNLRRLRWYLETWKEKGGPLCSVKRTEVSEKVLRHYRSDLGYNDELRDILYKVAGIFQFDVEFYGGGYDRAILSKFKKSGIITFREGTLHGGYYKLEHSTDASHIIDAFADHLGKNSDDITIEILKEYLLNKPVNYFELMMALSQSKKKRILSEIFEDQEIYKVIFDIIKQDCILKMSGILRYLTYARGKGEGLRSWVQYKNLWGGSAEEQKNTLKTKLTEASLSEISSLLSTLKRIDVNEKDWLENEILDDDVSAQKAKDASFQTIRNFTSSLSKEKRSAFISKLDPEIMADKVVPSSSKVPIQFFLKDCIRDPYSINFARSFLIFLNKNGKLTGLIEELKNYKTQAVQVFLRVIKHIDSDLFEEIKSTLSAYWPKILLSSGLNRAFVSHLYKYRWTSGKRKEDARLIVNNLASTGLSEQIRNLYSKPDTKPLKILGKLLHCVHQIAFKTDKYAIGKIAQEIVNNTDLKMRDRYTFEQLSLLTNNVKQCNELAWMQLCNRILSELNLNDYISIPFDQGLALLVGDIYQFNKEKGQELADKILRLDFNILLDGSEIKAISRLLWSLLQIDEPRTKSWVQNVENDKWLSNARKSSTCYDAFQLLWGLYHVDEEKGKNVTRSFANNMLSNLSTVKVKDLPLLGFFVFCDIPFDLKNISIPSPREIAEKISEDLSFDKLVFCICLLKRKSDELPKIFLKGLKKLLLSRDMVFSVKEMMEKHPFENTRKVLLKIFKDYEVQ